MFDEEKDPDAIATDETVMPEEETAPEGTDEASTDAAAS